MTSAPLPKNELDRLLAYLAHEDDFVFLETTRITADEHRSWLFRQPVDRLLCTAADKPAEFFSKARSALDQGHYLAGWFAYEFGEMLEPSLARRSAMAPDTVLADFGVFPTPHIFDHATGTFTGAGPWPLAPAREASDYAVTNPRLNETRERYLASIARIKAYIENGDTYQVNYTLKYLFDFHGAATALYTALRRSQSVSYGALLSGNGQRILSCSPELFFRRQGDRCTVRPMKGTMVRGRTTSEDTALASRLRNDPKNRSENIMIVDLLRNDLGRLSRSGSIAVTDLFTVETYETVHQMTSTIQSRLRPMLGLEEFSRALFPCGSVTGAPKIRTMEIIRELESAPRGVYTGGIGFFTPAGDGVFSVPIRTVVLKNGQGEMGIGSGVVADSDPMAEWEECLLKGKFLTSPRPEFQLIETMLWRPAAGYWLLDAHLARLTASARLLGFAMHRDQVLSALSDLSDSADKSDRSARSTKPARRVRLLLAKDGSLEITSSPCALPTMTGPPPFPGPTGEPLPVRLAATPTDRGSLYLFHKTTQRQLYDEEKKMAAGQGFFEVLFTNRQGELTEGSFTNVFVQRGDTLLTPPVACGLLNGVFRHHLLTTFPDLVREAVLTPADLTTADGLYVGNSVRGLVPVRPITSGNDLEVPKRQGRGQD
ncbi:MAG: aminodeoxychorismate synthase, component I [Desulfobacterales bacterium CG2_30_60_27]|nr:MAG: aminodeoxychorismate synthase, component I [Desulfobacterales bacterium CG2_30_60_27]